MNPTKLKDIKVSYIMIFWPFWQLIFVTETKEAGELTWANNLPGDILPI